MPNNIFHKRSLTPGSVPTTSSLNVGEIAINVPDGKIFLKKSGSAGQSVETVLVSNTTTDIGVLTLSGSLILSGSGTGSVLDVSAGSIDFDFDTLSFSGSASITGSLIVTGGITGSLLGTSSYATTALSSSYALSASYSTIALNASMATSSSYAVSASYAPSSVPSGIFGISNSSGVYTYYTTLTLAMAAAVSGQVIEMFADVTETGNVTITLKDGVNINGNGHTYTLNTTTPTNAFIATTTEVKMAFSNITLVKSGTGSGIVLGSGVATNQFNGKSCTIRVISPNSWGISVLTNLFTGYIDGFNVIATGSASNGIYTIRGTITNCFAVSTSGYGILSNLSNTSNCYGESLGAGSGIEAIGASGILTSCFGKSNTGVGIITSVITNGCTGISSGGTGLYTNSSAINGCTGISSSSKGLFSAGGIINSSYGYSAAEWGILIQNGKVNNSYGYSAASVGLQVFNNSQANNCVFETLSGSTCVGLSSATLGSINNCTIINLWNNASGHCLVANSTIPILNCVFEVANASAQAIYSASALTLKYASNTFKGSTTPVSAVITQGITNTFDNQGNILI